jgi:hypothetical protein
MHGRGDDRGGLAAVGCDVGGLVALGGGNGAGPVAAGYGLRGREMHHEATKVTTMKMEAGCRCG